MMKMKRLGEAKLSRRTGRVQVEILTTTESGTDDTEKPFEQIWREEIGQHELEIEPPRNQVI